jgi:hypothetical protein
MMNDNTVCIYVDNEKEISLTNINGNKREKMSPHPNHQLEIKQASSSPLKGAYLALGLTMINSLTFKPR